MIVALIVQEWACFCQEWVYIRTSDPYNHDHNLRYLPMPVLVVLCIYTGCCIFIDMHVFLVQRSSKDSDNNDDSEYIEDSNGNDDSEYSDDNDDSEDSSSQQAQLLSSLAATCSQSTASVAQQWPSDQRAQVRHEQQLSQPMFSQQQLPPPLSPRLPAGTVKTLPPESVLGDNFESASFLPPPSLSSPISHLGDGQPEEQHSM